MEIFTAQTYVSGIPLDKDWVADLITTAQQIALGVYAYSNLADKRAYVVVHVHNPKIRDIEGTLHTYEGAFFQINGLQGGYSSVYLSVYCLSRVHPHTGGGVMCMSRWEREFLAAIRQGDWFELICTVVSGLSSYNPNSPMVKMTPGFRFCPKCRMPEIRNGSDECIGCVTAAQLAITQGGDRSYVSFI